MPNLFKLPMRCCVSLIICEDKILVVDLILVFLITAQVQGKEKAIIYLKDFAITKGSFILLGEIAEIQTENKEFFKKLKEIRIGSSPLPGKSRNLNRDYILVRLYQNRVNSEEILLKGAHQICVSSSSRIIKKEEIIKLAKELVFPLYQGKELKIDEKRIPSSVIVPPNKVSLIPNIESSPDSQGYLIISIKIVVDSKIYQTIHFPARILSERGESKKVKSNISTFQSLANLPFIVNRGDIITLLAEGENIRVITRGKALESGKKGEKIKVLNVDSLKKIEGEIIDNKTVKISLR